MQELNWINVASGRKQEIQAETVVILQKEEHLYKNFNRQEGEP